MTVKEFRTLSRKKKNYEMIPVSLIRMVSDVHLVMDMSKIRNLSKPIKDILVIVHKNDDGTYNLIVGWKDYIIAIRDGIKEIKAILVNETNRDEFLHTISTSTDWVKLDNIHIPNCFTTHPPKKAKLNNYINDVRIAIKRYSLSDYLDKKPIVIDNNNVLMDGYTRYLALKTLNYKDKIPVIKRG